MRTVLAGVLAVAVLGLVSSVVLIASRQATPPAARQAVAAEAETSLAPDRGLPAPMPVEALVPPEVSAAERVVETRPASSNVETQPVKTVRADEGRAGGRAASTAVRQDASRDEGVPVALARAALSHVGADSLAEEVWVQAINDPNLSAHARQDLIEDLNEDGLPDPHHPTAKDLPLILRRLEIIDRLAPHAMDEVNKAAFKEARKDLMNMVARLSKE